MGNAASHPLHVQGEGALLMLLDTQQQMQQLPSSHNCSNINSSSCSSPATSAIHHHKPDAASLLPFSTPADLSALYSLAEKIGDGDTATVRRCISVATGVEYACKSIHKHILRTQEDRERVRNEVSILWKLSGSSPDLANIVQLQDVIEDADDVHIVMELCRGGSLLDRRQVQKKRSNVAVSSQAEARRIMKSLLEALHACHRRGIVYGDVKPANILFLEDSDDSLVKLADFGSAFLIHDKPVKRLPQQYEIHKFMAPEMLKEENDHKGGSVCYGKEVDAWSAGVLLYLLLSGALPFNGYDEQVVKRAILGEKIRYDGRAWNSVGAASAKRLLRQLLCREVQFRMSVEEALEHEWILGASSTNSYSNNTKYAAASYSYSCLSCGSGAPCAAAPSSSSIDPICL